MPVEIRKGISAGSFSLTPLIDVVFLLLIFFLVATRFEEEERDMDVELPQASAAEPTIFPGKKIYVTVTPEGQYFVENEQYTPAALERKLAELHLNNPGRQRVVIRADKDSRTAHLVTVMDVCNKANIRDYQVATQ